MREKMAPQDIIAALEERLDQLESTLGDISNLELPETLSKLSNELHRLFYEGQEFSDKLMGLLESFEANEPCKAISVKQETIVSCYDRLLKSLESLNQLDSCMQELSRFYARRLEPVELVKIQEIPSLMNKCSSLLAGSLLVAKRFMEMNIRYNQFWLSADSRLSKLKSNGE
ncbi:LDB18 (YLL049W) [Zygosaccharomyces parabailii]|nr:LDB18 (YLL049W) [Zygosaccharomyces parabailii]